MPNCSFYVNEWCILSTTTKNQERIEYKCEKCFFQYDNLEFRKLSNCIEVINDNIQDDDCNTYWDLGNKVLDEVKSKYPNPIGYDDTFILALIFI